MGEVRTSAGPRRRRATIDGARPLPVTLRALAATGGRVQVRGQEWLGVVLARTRLRDGTAYATPNGVHLRPDPLDYFERLMALGLYERHVVDMIRRFALPGTTVIDGGAHIGYTAVVAARAVGSTGDVHAFECDPRAVRRLREHVHLNETPWVHVTERALADTSDERAVLHVPPQVGWASTRTAPNGAWAAKLDVGTLTIDDYVHRAELDPTTISVIKLDLEGGELEALRGAPRTLAAGAPALIVEFIPDHSADGRRRAAELFEYLAAFEYEPFVPVAKTRRRRAVAFEPHDLATRADILFLRRGSEAWRLSQARP